MRFGISEISWMLPKILRIRRELVFRPLVVLRGASIALVAICFPALCESARSGAPRNCFPGMLPGSLLERCPATLSNSCGPCAVRTLSRRGREKPRAHVTVRRSRYLLDLADIVFFQQGARLSGPKEKGGTPFRHP